MFAVPELLEHILLDYVEHELAEAALAIQDSRNETTDGDDPLHDDDSLDDGDPLHDDDFLHDDEPPDDSSLQRQSKRCLSGGA